MAHSPPPRCASDRIICNKNETGHGCGIIQQFAFAFKVPDLAYSCPFCLIFFFNDFACLPVSKMSN